MTSSGIQGDGASSFPVIDDDGGVVAFQSDATNLVPGDTNGQTDVFAVNVATQAVTLVSQSAAGGPAERHERRSRPR